MVEDKSVQRVCELAAFATFKNYQQLLGWIADAGIEKIDNYRDDIKTYKDDLDAVEYACTVKLDIENPNKIRNIIEKLKKQFDFLEV